MTNPVMNFFALALYLSAAVLLGLRLARGEVVTGSAKIGILSLGSARSCYMQRCCTRGCGRNMA